MKLATWNVNDVVKRLPLILEWLAEARPDVVALQETKATDAAFPRAAFAAAGYGALIAGSRPWNGVALLAKGAEPVEIRRALPGDSADTQRRYLEAAVAGVIVSSIYLPNGNPRPGPKFAYKMAWFERLLAHAAVLMNSGHPVVLAGDFNVVPTTPTSIPRRAGSTTRCCSPSRAPPLRACSHKAGSTRSATAIRTSASIRSGTIGATAGRATPGCGSITCC